ncbi:Adenylylsulfatase HINT1 [Dichanthelium oligosanthes]|uniref:Adenylylsulfatase HINT1 n=1 Tax=Dichanthelium oligosanthes TaxID=888268 RepID=A0A1E5VK00_9POAL|nr:Adenylylsulfatase HINT1 [Dichanthelium oligosanthes]
MTRNSGSQLPPATAGGDRLAVIASHLSHSRLGSPAHMAGEKEAALATEPIVGPTIFDKIIRKEIPSQVVYEDQKVLAFRDISPQAPIHIIIIPKVKDGLCRLSKVEERHVEVLGSLLYAAKVVAKQEGLDDGFRVVINDGPKGCEYPSLTLMRPILSVAIRLICLSSVT